MCHTPPRSLVRGDSNHRNGFAPHGACRRPFYGTVAGRITSVGTSLSTNQGVADIRPIHCLAVLFVFALAGCNESKTSSETTSSSSSTTETGSSATSTTTETSAGATTTPDAAKAPQEVRRDHGLRTQVPCLVVARAPKQRGHDRDRALHRLAHGGPSSTARSIAISRSVRDRQGPGHPWLGLRREGHEGSVAT